ncbi:MAG: CheR family methyltransferase, partial [Planctomycetota bacterium]
SAQLKIWIAAGQSRFRFWSAASSTGEEPYTLAITLLELARGLGKKLDLKILATDLSNRVLKEASRGEYAEARLKGVNKGLQSRYFRPVPGDDKKTVCVADEVRSMVSFHRLNLSQIPYAMKGPLDAIFVRNVMIYFDDKGRDDVVGECHRMLRPDGLLIVGKSESLVRSGELFDRAAPSVYRKRDS